MPERGDRSTGPSPGALPARGAGGAAELDERRVGALLDSMTLAEKVGQMALVELGSITPDEAAVRGVGAILSGGGGNPGDGSASGWRDAVEAYVAASRGSRTGIPVLYGADAVHGHNNVRDATIFPHHLGLGATGDPDLVRRVARAAALETAATGVRWSFAPCLAVVRDPRWGRTYESFGAAPELVAELGRAEVEGWHGDDLPRDGVLACPKHFVGEGAAVWGTAGRHRHPWIDWWDGWGDGWRIDQGDVRVDEAELRRTHLPPFAAAVGAGALTVMAGYGSWRGERLHGHRYLLTEVLKTELGFGGFVVSDWMAVQQLHPDLGVAVERAVLAGVDMVMVPFEHERFVATVLDLVAAGRLPPARVDDAVRRVLRVKARLGLLDGRRRPAPDLDLVGHRRHRELARAAVRASVVVLHGHDALPVPPGSTLLAAGDALDDVGISCGGWTISWMGGAGAVTDGRTVLDGLRRLAGADRVTYERRPAASGPRASCGVVSVHELPYAEGVGDRDDLSVPPDQVEVVRRVRSRVDRLVVVVVSGRPLELGPVLQLADAVVAGWLPGSEADGVAEVLLGGAPPTARLPLAWPAVPGAPRWSVDERLDRGADEERSG